ncbi:MAG: hypothetical protein GX758_00225 [Tenericutes bacterium]|nr:hypothetical protein [Mycoplasmatota bacterium]
MDYLVPIYQLLYIGSNDGMLCIRFGIKIIDINNDGHPDMIRPGGNGYVDIYINNYNYILLVFKILFDMINI